MPFRLSSIRQIFPKQSDVTLLIRALFAISLLLIAALSYSYYRVNKEVFFYTERVDKTQGVLVTLSNLSSSIHSVNYHIRTYGQLGMSANRIEAERGISQLPGLTLRLDSLVSDIPPESYRAQRIRELVLKIYRIPDTGQPVPKDSSQALAIAREFALTENHSEDVFNLNKLIEEMNVIESKLVESRISSRENFKAQIFRYNWVIMLVACVFLTAAFVLLDREVGRSKRLQFELEKRVENLNRSNRELEEFAYVASHDLQEPLRKIQSFSERIIFKHGNEVGGAPMEMLNRISASAARMRQLVNDLLSFSRLVRVVTPMEKVDLAEVLEEAKGNLSILIKEKKATIISEKLPKIDAYPTQMLQLFQNLLSNSLRYSKPGMAPVIQITASILRGSELPDGPPGLRQTTFWNLTFADNGLGFDQDYAEKIFTIFKRLHGRAQFEGTGIGLAICRRVVSNHNGYIKASGEKGKGATFSIFLPQ